MHSFCKRRKVPGLPFFIQKTWLAGRSTARFVWSIRSLHRLAERLPGQRPKSGRGTWGTRLNGLPQIPAHELRVPIDPVQGARHDVLLCRVDRPGEGFHPIRPRSRPHRRPPRCLHHFVSHPAEEEGIGLVEVLDRVTMQVFVRWYYTMIAAPVQCEVDGIPKRPHYARVPPMG